MYKGVREKLDRLEYAIGNAFGKCNYKILLNPLMIICYHPDCFSKQKQPIKLKNPCSLSRYLDRLLEHADQIGKVFYDRFEILNNDIYHSDYDAIRPSPYSLLVHLQVLVYAPIDHKLNFVENYGIRRDFKGVYVAHWKGKLIKKGYLLSDSLQFQQDDALVSMVFKYPRPIENWTFWITISLYSLKLFTSISSAAVNIYSIKPG